MRRPCRSNPTNTHTSQHLPLCLVRQRTTLACPWPVLASSPASQPRADCARFPPKFVAPDGGAGLSLREGNGLPFACDCFFPRAADLGGNMGKCNACLSLSPPCGHCVATKGGGPGKPVSCLRFPRGHGCGDRHLVPLSAIPPKPLQMLAEPMDRQTPVDPRRPTLRHASATW